MKSKIKFSRYALIITILVFMLLYIGCIASVHTKPAFFIFLALFLVFIICSLLYGCAYIQADKDYIKLGSLLKSKRIPIGNVASVEMFQPTMGVIRIFGAGGFMGYWGIFREGDIGRYYAFYGKSSECFLVRLKNGDKYVLGCENPQEMVDYIKNQLNHRQETTVHTVTAPTLT